MIYVLQHVEALEILLQGLCGVHKEPLRTHELCLKSGPNLGQLPFVLFNIITVQHVSSSMDRSIYIYIYMLSVLDVFMAMAVFRNHLFIIHIYEFDFPRTLSVHQFVIILPINHE